MVTSTYSGPGYIVIDDFLSPEHHTLVWNYIQAEKFEYVHSKRWTKAFRLTDGQPLWGPVYLSDAYEPDTQSTVYPSGQGIDLVIQAVKQLVPSCIDLIGEQYKDWAYFFARSYLYTIKKVDPAAGDHVRATIQGFFQDPAGILKRR